MPAKMPEGKKNIYISFHWCFNLGIHNINYPVINRRVDSILFIYGIFPLSQTYNIFSCFFLVLPQVST